MDRPVVIILVMLFLHYGSIRRAKAVLKEFHAVRRISMKRFIPRLAVATVTFFKE